MTVTIREPGSALTHFIGFLMALIGAAPMMARAVAIAGIVIKLFWITCPKWFSSVLYIGMGWLCVSVMGALKAGLSAGAFGWLLAGGIIYTVGGVIYALKLPIFNAKHKYFGSHEIFHLFVMGGSFCHFICMYSFILK